MQAVPKQNPKSTKTGLSPNSGARGGASQTTRGGRAAAYFFVQPMGCWPWRLSYSSAVALEMECVYTAEPRGWCFCRLVSESGFNVGVVNGSLSLSLFIYIYIYYIYGERVRGQRCRFLSSRRTSHPPPRRKEGRQAGRQAGRRPRPFSVSCEPGRALVSLFHALLDRASGAEPAIHPTHSCSVSARPTETALLVISLYNMVMWFFSLSRARHSSSRSQAWRSENCLALFLGHFLK